MGKTRIEYLDMAKGVGILLVVIGHSTYASEWLLDWISAFHMPLFFVISGVLLCFLKEEEKGIKASLLKRACGLLVPYFSFSVIFMLIKLYYYYAVPGILSQEAMKVSVIQSLSFYGISVLWFLPALFLGEMAFLTVRKKCNHIITIGIGVGLFLLAVVGKPFLEVALPMAGSAIQIAIACFLRVLLRVGVAYLFLLTGYYICFLFQKRDWMQKKNTWDIGKIIVGSVLLGVTLVLSLKNQRVDMNFLVFENPVLYYLNALLGSLGVIVGCMGIPSMLPLRFLGKNSLIIMVTHLECQLLMFAIRFTTQMQQLLHFEKAVVFYAWLAFFLLLMELVCIVLINRYLYFLLGRNKPIKGVGA